MSREYKSVSDSMSEGGPAFPGKVLNTSFAGMTLRDYFAAQVMHGDWACQGDKAGNDIENDSLKMRADVYYRMAEAMLEARK